MRCGAHAVPSARAWSPPWTGPFTAVVDTIHRPVTVGGPSPAARGQGHRRSTPLPDTTGTNSTTHTHSLRHFTPPGTSLRPAPPHTACTYSGGPLKTDIPQ